LRRITIVLTLIQNSETVNIFIVTEQNYCKYLDKLLLFLF
jgi:hypothetical protein